VGFRTFEHTTIDQIAERSVVAEITTGMRATLSAEGVGTVRPG
jgi:hypothetical protein